MNECRHLLTNGCKCKSPALRGQPYCYFHTRVHRHNTQPPIAPQEPLRIPVLEDQNAIQLAVSQVLDALASSRLDRAQAALFLRGIQIAAGTVYHGFIETSSSPVDTVTQSESGDDLGPEERSCYIPYTCSKCSDKDTCRDYKSHLDRKAQRADVCRIPGTCIDCARQFTCTDYQSHLARQSQQSAPEDSAH